MTYSTYKIPEDERIRQECEARERYLLKEKAAKKKERAYKKTKKENEKLKQQLAQANSEVDLQFIQIPDHHIQLTRIHPGRRLYDCIRFGFLRFHFTKQQIVCRNLLGFTDIVEGLTGENC